MKKLLILSIISLLTMNIKGQDISNWANTPIKYWEINEDYFFIKTCTYKCNKIVPVDSLHCKKTDSTFSYMEKDIYFKPDVFPKYHKGHKGIKEYLNDTVFNVLKPDYHILFKAIIIISEEGEVLNVGIIEGDDHFYNVKIVDLLRKMKGWIPAIDRNINVNSFTIIYGTWP